MSQISDARLAANRENAKKSTGPRTQEGKERSRQNALKHGMTAGVVIVEELREKVDERVKSWKETMRPNTAPEAWLVERAAVDSVRVDAATRCERARMEGWLRNRALRFRAEGIPEINAAKSGRRLLEVHHTEVPTMLLDLSSHRAGCQWMLMRWEDLKRRHQAQGAWTKREFFEAQRLRGMSYLDDVVSPVMARMAVEFLLSSPTGIENNHDVASALARACWDIDAMAGPGHAPGNPETIARANQRLAEVIDAEIEALHERLESLVEVEELDASLAVERDLIDLSADGKLLHRYECELVRRVQHSLDVLARIRTSTSERASEQPAQPEPPRSETDVNAPQSFENPPRNEPNPVAAPQPETCSPSVLNAPQSFENPPRNEPNPPAISLTPSTPPSPILKALAATPIGGLYAARDELMRRVSEPLHIPPPLRKPRRKGA